MQIAAGDPQMGRVCRNSVRSAADRFNKTMKYTIRKVVTVVFTLLPLFGLLGCGGNKKYTAGDIVLINTVYYGTEINPVYSFAMKKEDDCWFFSADCLVGSQKEHYTSFGSFPIATEDAEAFLRIICEDGEIERLYKHRNPIRFFHIADVSAHSSGMTFSDGSTIEKEIMLGGRALNYLYALADRYYEAAESSEDTMTDTEIS